MLPKTMTAAVLVRPGAFEIQMVPMPQIGPGDVLIKVARVGVCGTDIHIYRGHYAAGWLPLIPGHEFSGTVAAVGDGVIAVDVGMRVIADINIGCGHLFLLPQERGDELLGGEAARHPH